MPQEHLLRRVPQSAAQMFDLVADVERYPEFLPGCRGLRVVHRSGDRSAGTIVAEMKVGYKFITERFTCRITLDRSRSLIQVDYVDGPLSRLENAWQFRDLEEGGSEVDFTIAFELSSQRLGMIVNALFDRVFLRFVDAFEARAQSMHPIYPGRSPAAGVASPITS